LLNWFLLSANAADCPSTSVSSDVTHSECLKSVVWKHFGVDKNSNETIQKGKHVTCKLYSQKVAHGGKMTNLKDYLQTKH